jgi:hypothetical protein
VTIVTLSPPPPTKKISKNIIIASVVIAIVLIASVAGVMMGLPATQSGNSPTPTPSPTETPTTNSSTPIPSSAPYDFTISSISNISITQGQHNTDQIKLITISGNASSINPQDVIWSADSGSSGIHYDFKTSYSYENDYFASAFPDLFVPNGFNCVLTITVSSSTPTDNYNINITAAIGSVSRSISMLVSVPSAVVTVSGTVDASILGITPSQIAFLNKGDANDHYNATFTGNTYSISVANGREYYVMIGENTAYESNGRWYNWISCDPCNVGVPVGSTSKTKDITAPTEAIKSNPIITVSGTFTAGNSGITGSQLKFQNLAGGKLFYATLTESGTYSIDLPNYCRYFVCVDDGIAPNGAVRWHSVDTLFSIGVPAGSTLMTHDFTVPTVPTPPSS